MYRALERSISCKASHKLFPLFVIIIQEKLNPEFRNEKKYQDLLKSANLPSRTGVSNLNGFEAVGIIAIEVTGRIIRCHYKYTIVSLILK